jgi:hypothetical protein
MRTPNLCSQSGQVFGWMKTIGGLRWLRHRGGELVDWIVTSPQRPTT